MEENKPKLVPIHFYELIELQNDPNTKALTKDGLMVNCHKVAPILVPNPLSQTLNITPTPCSTRCTRFLLCQKQDDEHLYVIQNCEVQTQSFKIMNATTEPKKPVLEIIR
jgi:hypothetical protein